MRRLLGSALVNTLCARVGYVISVLNCFVPVIFFTYSFRLSVASTFIATIASRGRKNKNDSGGVYQFFQNSKITNSA